MLPCVVWSFIGMVHQYLEEKGGDSEATSTWGHSSHLQRGHRAPSGKRCPQQHPASTDL